MSNLVINLASGISESISISAVSAQSAVINDVSAVIYTTEACFIRQGSDPTAVSTGIDVFIPAGSWIRLTGIKSGNKLAFITASGTGTVYITPGA